MLYRNTYQKINKTGYQEKLLLRSFFFKITLHMLFKMSHSYKKTTRWLLAKIRSEFLEDLLNHLLKWKKYLLYIHLSIWFLIGSYIMWNVSRYGVFSGPYFPAFGNIIDFGQPFAFDLCVTVNVPDLFQVFFSVRHFSA